jgi:hypothetical protein
MIHAYSINFIIILNIISIIIQFYFNIPILLIIFSLNDIIVANQSIQFIFKTSL